MSNVIDNFVRNYEQMQDFYEKVAKVCERQLSGLLKQAGIRAITSSRAKSSSSLHDKLMQRDAKRVQLGRVRYEGSDDIVNDIRDLAGVRVALYFPKDASVVNALIQSNYIEADAPRSFPSNEPRPAKKFGGYIATHHLVRLRDVSQTSNERRYLQARCEIQVASLLMHAWSEVDHDLEYKEMTGEISSAESALLDQLNGLAIAGEIALSQLQDAMLRRVQVRESTLRDQYDLAQWLLAVERETTSRRRGVGEVEYAFRFLLKLGLTKFTSLQKYEPSIRRALTEEDQRLMSAKHGTTTRPVLTGGGQQLTLTNTLLDVLLANNPEHAGVLEAARSEAILAAQNRLPPSSSHQIGNFIRQWQEMELAPRIAALLRDHYVAKGDVLELLDKYSANSEVREDYARLRTVRDGIVHGLNFPSDDIKQHEHSQRTLREQLLKSLFSYWDMTTELKWYSFDEAPPGFHASAAVAAEEFELVVLPLRGAGSHTSIVAMTLSVGGAACYPRLAIRDYRGPWDLVRLPQENSEVLKITTAIVAFSTNGVNLARSTDSHATCTLYVSWSLMDGPKQTQHDIPLIFAKEPVTGMPATTSSSSP